MNLSLKRALTSSLFILLFTLFPAGFIKENGAAYAQIPFKIGERLTYNVAFSNITSAAHVEIEVLARGQFYGRDAVQLHAHVRTTGLVNVALMSIDNEYLTYVDPGTGLPFRTQATESGADESDTSVAFNQSEETPAKQGGLPGIYDLLSVFYRMRALPLAEGARYSVTVKAGGSTYTAEIKVAGGAMVKTPVASYDTLMSEVKISGNSPLRSLRVYVSADEHRIPVLITAKVSTGDLRAELAASEIIAPAPAASPTPAPAPTITAVPTPTPRVNSTRSPAVMEWPFKLGEQLNYQVFLSTSATPVGTASFQVRSRDRYFDKDGLQVVAKAQTIGAAARVFSANDQITSYLDPVALLPYRSEFNLIEGKRRRQQTLTYNQDYGAATIEGGARIEIPVGTFDYLSFFYAVRTFNLNPPKRNAISILVENKPKTLFVTSIKRETITLANQLIPAVALALTTDDPQSDKYQLRLWVSDDRRRLPLRITCSTELGPVRADLVILPTTSQ